MRVQPFSLSVCGSDDMVKVRARQDGISPDVRSPTKGRPSDHRAPLPFTRHGFNPLSLLIIREGTDPASRTKSSQLGTQFGVRSFLLVQPVRDQVLALRGSIARRTNHVRQHNGQLVSN